MRRHELWFIAGRYTAHLGAALLLVTSAACCNTDADRTHRYIADGDRFARVGKYAEASIEYRDAIKLTPSSVEAHEKLADAAARGGQPALAADALRRVAELKPDDRSAQLRAASIYLLSGRYEESKARAEAAIQVDPMDAVAHFLLGEALAGLHEQASSEASLRDAIRLAPGLPMPHVALGSKYWSAGNAVEAEAELRKAVELSPADLSANRALAIFLMATGRGAQAEPAWAVVSASPRGLPFALADYFVAMNRLGEAERALVALTASDVNRDAARVRLAAVQSARNRPVDAHRTIEAVLRDAPHSVPALLLEARLLQSERRFDEALRVAQSAVAANPNSPEPLLVEGDIFATRGDDSDADRSFERAATLSPDDPRPFLAQAKYRLARGRALESVRIVERARAIAPDDLETRLMLISALAQAGQRTSAIQAGEAAIRDWPRQVILYLQLGRLQFADGRPDKARVTLSTAVRLDPTSIAALRALVELEMREGQARSALTRIEQRLQKQPGSSELLLLASQAYAADGQNEKAEAMFARLVELDPSGSGGTMLGILLEEQNHPADAERAFERALATNPFDGIAANNLAWLYQREGRLDEALRWATVANEQLRSGETSDTLGWIHVQRGECREALPMLLGAIQAKPENPLYHYHLAVAYSKTGSPVQARDELHRALASDMTFSGREDATRLRASLESAGTRHQALLAILDTLEPAERLAFVLHDLFAMPFDEIAEVVGRSTDATRQLASRARRRIQGSPTPQANRSRQRQIVDAYLAAAREGNFDALMSLLDPNIVLRADHRVLGRGGPAEIRDAAAIAERAVKAGARAAQPALIDGEVGVVVAPRAKLLTVLKFTVAEGKIVEIEAIADRVRLRQLDLAVLA